MMRAIVHLRHALRFTVAALLLVAVTFLAAHAETMPDFRKVAKFAISYDDKLLGLVEGIALCDWGTSSGGAAPSCKINLRNPLTGALKSTVISVTFHDPDPAKGGVPWLSFVLPMDGAPSADPTVPPAAPDQQVAGTDGESASVILKNGDVERNWKTPVARSGAADAQITFELAPDLDGGLSGSWRYLADPLTERGRGGAGPVGTFWLLSDTGIKNLAVGPPSGGFLGLETGAARWRPLLPRISEYTKIEDETEVHLTHFRYPLTAPQPTYQAFMGAADSAGEAAYRTLVFIGRDLPVDGKKTLLDIESETPGLSYTVVAISDGLARPLSDAQNQIERAFQEQTRGMSTAEAAQYRKQDAVLVRVLLAPKPEPGPQYFTWGTLRWRWELQYGRGRASSTRERE